MLKRVILSLFAAATLLFAGVAPAQVAVDAAKTGIARAPHLLCGSSVASSVTGTVNETALATCTIPAGAMGLNGGVEVRSVWSNNNSAGNKTPRIRLGGIAGTQYLTAGPVTTTIAYGDIRRIRNRGSASSQVGSWSVGSTPFGTSSAAPVTSAIDMTASVDLVLSGQLGSGADTLTLESYEVWLLP